jgi:phosphate transport system substrate-binding protein
MWMKNIVLRACLLSLFLAPVAVADTLVIKGSTTVLPIAQRAIEAYMADHPEVRNPSPAGAPATASAH